MTNGFLLLLLNYTLSSLSIFSKRQVKSYLQSKIKLCGIAFEQMDSY